MQPRIIFISSTYTLFNEMKGTNLKTQKDALETLRKIVKDIIPFKKQRIPSSEHLYINSLIKLLNYLDSDESKTTFKLLTAIKLVKENQKEVLDYRELLQNIYNVSVKKGWEFDPKITPVYAELYYNHYKINLLLEIFANNQPWFIQNDQMDLSAKDGKERTIMDFAIETDDFPIIDFLLSKNEAINLNLIQNKLLTYINNSKWIDIILRSQNNWDTQNEQVNMSVMQVFKYGNIDQIDLVLSKVKNLTFIDYKKDANSAISKEWNMVFSREIWPEIVSLLLDKGYPIPNLDFSPRRKNQFLKNPNCLYIANHYLNQRNTNQQKVFGNEIDSELQQNIKNKTDEYIKTIQSGTGNSVPNELLNMICEYSIFKKIEKEKKPVKQSLPPAQPPTLPFNIYCVDFETMHEETHREGSKKTIN